MTVVGVWTRRCLPKFLRKVFISRYCTGTFIHFVSMSGRIYIRLRSGNQVSTVALTFTKFKACR
ncbi:hypothetical protein BDR03DRAFT_650024 [Suillus americanus]|nr:hypothetical protein BDR03DRAFT_650024 [Suillus americanus]